MLFAQSVGKAWGAAASVTFAVHAPRTLSLACAALLLCCSAFAIIKRCKHFLHVWRVTPALSAASLQSPEAAPPTRFSCQVISKEAVFLSEVAIDSRYK